MLISSKFFWEEAGMGADQDILLDIPDEDLPKLAKIYEPYKDWIPFVYSIITTGIEWRKKKIEKHMIFMSPNGCWKKDGTFVVLLAYYSFDIFIFSLDETGKSVYEAILKTRRLDPGDYKDREQLLYSTHYKVYPTVIKALKDKGKTIIEEIPCHMFSIPREKALKFEVECPQDLYIKKLDRTHAAIVNAGWPHRYKDSEKYVTLILEMNEGYGLFLKSNDELVSWVLVSMLGQLAMLQTADAHKKKGYATIILKYLSKIIASRGHNPYGTVLEQNKASVNLFQKLGFSNLGIATYSFYE